MFAQREKKHFKQECERLGTLKWQTKKKNKNRAIARHSRMIKWRVRTYRDICVWKTHVQKRANREGTKRKSVAM